MSAVPPNPGLSPRDLERLDDLLADRAVFGLNPTEAAELERLQAAAGAADESAYDQIALAAAAPRIDEPLPPIVRDRVLDEWAERRAPTVQPAATPITLAADKQPPWPKLTMLAVAAGLLISLGLTGLWSEPAAVRERAALIEEAPDLRRVSWSPLDDPLLKELPPGSDHGDVVWSDKRQTGYMRFRCLRRNDPAVEQYQLWIVDKNHDINCPIDGGVFDITRSNEEVVAVRPRKKVCRAKVFAVTVEKPGGVKASDLSRMPVMADPRGVADVAPNGLVITMVSLERSTSPETDPR